MMHRFRVRTKSDASKRSVSEAPAIMPLPSPAPKLDSLPPESDFRTSLIMPSLSRRFTLLRGQNGEPLSIDDVRSRLAQQRANGHVNHVTEEEEEIMIGALIRAHSIDPTASASDSDGYTTATANDGYSTANTGANDSFVSGYDSPRPFGSSSYLRSATKSLVSANPPKRKVTISNASASARDTPKHTGPLAFNVSATGASKSVGTGSISFDTYLSNSSFSPAQIRRASLALQDAIQEFEEDEEDERILAPRSGPRKGGSQEHDLHAARSESPVGYGEAIAWPNDQSQSQSQSSSREALGSISPHHNPGDASSPSYKMDSVNRLPGYVPGMHRPITPRDSAVDTDTTTGTSTPQPTSSMSGYDYSSSSVSSPARTERALPPSILLNKRASTNNSPLRTRPREFSNADQYDAGGSASDTTQVPLKSALSDRRRPTSPLVDSAYQSAIRSSTPSNNFADAWSPTSVSFATTPPPRIANSSSASVRDGHSRQASNTSSGADTSEGYYSNQSQPRSAASPALPDSPTINGSSGLANIASSWNGATTNVIVDEPVHRTSTPRLSPLDSMAAQRGLRSYSPHLRSGTPNGSARRGHSRSGSLADTTTGRRSPRASNTTHSPSGLRQNPLMMSPMLNSSRSSLASTGSSYHSWDEDQLGGKKPHKRGVSVFIDSDSAPWKKHQSGFDIAFGTENAPAPEDIKDVLAGLTVQDIVAVQEKLVSAAVRKRVNVPAVRPPSGQKRRRASAGQSVGSVASPTEPEVASPPRVVSPPPIAQPQSPNILNTIPQPSTPPPTGKSAEDQAKKANALLHAMMDSIESSPHKPTSPAPVITVRSPPPQPQELAPQTSFSSEEPQSTTPPSPADEPLTPDTPVPEQDPRQKALADALFGSDSDATVKDSNLGRSQSLRAFAMPPAAPEPTQVKDRHLPVKETGKDSDQILAEEIERRAMAATAALKNSSAPRLNEAATNGRKAGKKLNTKQISGPQLVSATTSVDTIALSAVAGSNPSTPISQQAPQSLQHHAQSKLSQRIKKFTGNLRTRAPIPMGEEISPYVVDAPALPSTDQAQTNPSTRTPSSPDLPKSVPTSSDARSPATPTLDESASSSNPGTPTSAPPRLRGFMARLRKGRKDSTDIRDRSPRAPSPLGPNASKAAIPPPPHIPAAALKVEPVRMPENLSSSSLAGSGVGIESPPPPPGPPPLSAPANIGSQTTATPHLQSHKPVSSQQMDEEAIRQLYNAASQLGLDRSAINDILVRSQSTSSRSTAWTQLSAGTPLSVSDTPITPPLPPASTLERAMSMTTPKTSRGSTPLTRQLSLKPYNGIRPLREPVVTSGDNPTAIQASVVRRTVIFPSPPGRASSEMVRRSLSSRHQRTRSGSIHSNKSVQERVPTPPPSRAPAIKRFSKEAFPPVPQLPSGVEGSVTPALQLSRSGSAFGSASIYDSLYEMYAENIGPQDSAGQEGEQNEQVPITSAVEVLELSDGQLIWSVVDGLRAAGEDYEGDESMTFPRISRTSEYSAHDTHELRFREHQRSASKSSTTSTVSKPGKQPQPNRPETRVYFSNAGDITTLIDSLTKNTEAGQFNIIPGVPTTLSSLRPQSGAQSAHSFNSSFNSFPDGDWTLEERIDQMIAASRKRAGL